MNKKGFTMFELLAVIIILAILALIAIPIIMGVTENSRKSALSTSAENIIRAAKDYIKNSGQTEEPIFFLDVDLASDEAVAFYKGEKPESGRIIVDEDGLATLWMYKGGLCAYKKEVDENVTVESVEEGDCAVLADAGEVEPGYEFSEEYAYINTAALDRAHTFTVPKTGYYRIELWGASGDNKGIYVGGKGGYTKGTIYLTEGENLYIYIGGKGNAAVSGYNGGGNASSSTSAYGTAGGGATDVRLTAGAWNLAAGLKDRIMVAAGGGGTGNRGSNYGDGNGGAGGNLIGADGQFVNYSTGPTYAGYGGTQLAGGGVRNNATYVGAFGTAYTAATYVGGGGGYYGGGGYAHGGGGGGSSFISGYGGSVAISSSSLNTPTCTTSACSVNHYSGKYFINAQMKPGVNTGDGKAKITYVSSAIPKRVNTKFDSVRYVRTCQRTVTDTIYLNYPVWNELQVIKNGVNIAKGKTVTGTLATDPAAGANYSNLVDGDINNTRFAHGISEGANCLTVDLGSMQNIDEIALWTYWGDDRIYRDLTLEVSPSGSNWKNIFTYTTYVGTSKGIRYNAWSNSVINES